MSYLKQSGRFAADELSSFGRAVAKRPGRTGGWVMFGLLALVFIYMYPELQRYIKIKRM